MLLGASLAHAASPTAGSSGTQSNGTTPGAIGGTQQSLQPTGPSGSGMSPTAPTVETSPGTVGGPSYNPSSEMPTESGSAGTAGTDTRTGG